MSDRSTTHSALELVGDGWRRCPRLPCSSFAVWLLTLAVTWPSAWALERTIAADLGRARRATTALHGVDASWWLEFRQRHPEDGESFRPSVIGFRRRVAESQRIRGQRRSERHARHACRGLWCRMDVSLGRHSRPLRQAPPRRRSRVLRHVRRVLLSIPSPGGRGRDRLLVSVRRRAWTVVRSPVSVADAQSRYGAHGVSHSRDALRDLRGAAGRGRPAVRPRESTGGGRGSPQHARRNPRGCAASAAASARVRGSRSC